MELEKWETLPEKNYEINRKDLIKKKALTHGAWLSPVLLTTVPALVVFLFGFFLTNPLLIFLSLFLLIGGFITGLMVSGGLLFYRQRWIANIRERMAVDGIKTEEVEWFQHELTSAERKALKEVEAQNRLLGDAYRETLATRLTATRLIKSAKKELNLNQKQQNKLKYSKVESSTDFQDELKRDFEKLSSIKTEAEQMKLEAENRLHQIEKAFRHGSNFSDTEMALKKLSARNSELPLALEAMKMEDEARRELEAELEEK